MTEALRQDGRIPLTILGGFLGAGKSTWLRHQLHVGSFADHHVLVNEAAETPVDNLLLGRARMLTILAGGCACCYGRGDLLDSLLNICDSAVAGDDTHVATGILLETSGLADPAAIAGALAHDPVLARRLVIDRTMVLIDALHGLSQIAQEPLARAQIEAADGIVLTKTSMADPAALAGLVATLRQMNPAAELSAAEHGVAVPLSVEEVPPLALSALPNLAPIRPFRLRVGHDGGWVALSIWLSALLSARGDDIVRVKGVVRSPAGRLLLQSVRRIVQPPEILPDSETGMPDPEEGTLVLIGRGIDEERLERSWRRFGA